MPKILWRNFHWWACIITIVIPRPIPSFSAMHTDKLEGLVHGKWVLSQLILATLEQGLYSVVPQTVAKIAICDRPMVSGDCLVILIAKVVRVGGV